MFRTNYWDCYNVVGMNKPYQTAFIFRVLSIIFAAMAFQLSQLKIEYITSGEGDIWERDLQFEPAKLYHIRASSGKGKSSFIHTLYGMQKRYSGELFFRGKLTALNSPDEWCAIRTTQLSIVFQDLRLFDDYTAVQNLLIKNELTGFAEWSRIKTFAERLGITHTFDRPINTLSYGERQRVAIIRALLQPFGCILLDEPFSHLDNENKARAAALLSEEISLRQATMILCDLEDDQHFPYHQKLHL